MNSFMERLFNMSLQAGILILLLLLLQQATKKHISPRLRYGLWLLPALRLLIPVRFASRLSLMPILQMEAQAPAALPVIPVVNGSAPQSMPVTPAILQELPAASIPQGAQEIAAAPTPQAQPDMMTVLFWIWLGGAILILCYMLYVNLRFFRQTQTTRKPLEQAGKLPVYLVPALASPCLCGYFSPVILVNEAALISADTLLLVLRHELCHDKAKDQWWALLRNFCCAVHWFNPLVWWAAFRSRADCELACDARVMQGFTQPERVSYGMALLSIIRTGGKRPGHLVNTATSMTGGKRELKERITRIGRKQKTLLLATVAVLICAAAFALAACSERIEQKDKSYAQALFDGRTQYVGDNAAVGNLLGVLQFPQEMEQAKLTFELFTSAEPYGLKATFMMEDAAYSTFEQQDNRIAIEKNALALFALIENMEQLEIEVTNGDRATVWQYSGSWAGYILGNMAYYRQSVAQVEELLAVVPPELPRGAHIVSKLKNGRVESSLGMPLSAEDNAACDDAINLFFITSAAWEAQDISTLEDCYCIEKINTSIVAPAEVYYVFLMNGKPAAQAAGSNWYSNIMPESYNAIAALFHDAGFAIEPEPPMPTPEPAYDRTNPTQTAEEFLQRYFDEMATGNTNWNWDANRKDEIGGLVARDPQNTLYNDNILLLQQWILYKQYLAETGYRIDVDIGRFEALEVKSFGAVDSKIPGIEYQLIGYFKTSAFSTLVDLGMCLNEKGEYAIVSVDFPDWKEYIAFCSGFKQYMLENDLMDYHKTAYIASLRKQRDQAISERESVWKQGRRICEPFSVRRSFIEIADYGITMNSNGVELAKDKLDTDTICFDRKEEGVTLLHVIGNSLPSPKASRKPGR